MLDCKEIVQLNIPCLLKRLHSLCVHGCQMLKVVESYAPNIATFHFSGHVHAVRMLGLLQVKDLEMSCLDRSSILCYALTNLLSIAPNIEKLGISSRAKIRDIYIPQGHMGHPWTLGDPEQLRQVPEHRHVNLKKFEVVSFCYAKSLVELTCHILETASSLNHVKLDNCGFAKFCASGSGRCCPHYTEQIMEACNAALGIRTYIMGKVPPTVKFNLIEPCSRYRAPVQ
uniref:At1g61320/AtMIF1 LRR domain-containing protein n=1 Tax=Oryza punctata TaxID=4537 RepID=A0A0E0M317_ORYPU